MIEVLGADRMRVQLETGEVREPGQSSGRTRHDLVGGAAGGKAQRNHFDPGWPRLGRTFLIERRSVDPIREPDEHVGAPAGAPLRAVCNGHVIVDEIELGVLRLWYQQIVLVRVRELVIS